jgi:YidC/Oxa1 family membrane protein insertase
VDLFEIIGWFWNNGLVIPMTNLLVLLSRVAFGSYGLAIIIFTLLMRGITWPLTRQQIRASRAMQAAQPRIQAIQKQYKDPRRRSEETMKVYKEAGFSPLGCVWPMLIQMPIWFALFRSIRFTLGSTPENLLTLSQRLYPWSYLRTSVPLENHFLWMDMGRPDTTMIMAVLVGVSTWVQQRMTTPMTASADPQQQQMNNMMVWMMPLMFAFFTLQFPSGLALYWVATNCVGVVLQYFYQGPSEFSWGRIFSMGPVSAPAGQSTKGEETKVAVSDEREEAEEAKVEGGATGTKRKRRRRRGRQRRR